MCPQNKGAVAGFALPGEGQGEGRRESGQALTFRRTGRKGMSIGTRPA